MAQFRAVIQGQKGSASRLGSKNSGLTVHADGWNAGVTVLVSHVLGKDMFIIYRTGGSNGAGGETRIAEFTE